MIFTVEDWRTGKPSGWFAFCNRNAKGGPIRKHRWAAWLDGFVIIWGRDPFKRRKRLRVKVTYQ